MPEGLAVDLVTEPLPFLSWRKMAFLEMNVLNIPAEVIDDLDNELTHSYKWGKKFNSLHEAYAVLLEEVEEVWEITKQKKNERDKEKLYKELIQVAAMAIKSINSLENCVGNELGKS